VRGGKYGQRQSEGTVPRVERKQKRADQQQKKQQKRKEIEKRNPDMT